MGAENVKGEVQIYDYFLKYVAGDESFLQQETKNERRVR